MPKDPAILWYWNDWNGGTATFSRHLKGCYMDLLSAQFNSGPLSLDQVKSVLGSDKALWAILSVKFKKEVNSDQIEVFFNERMETEKIKRKAFTDSRKENLSKIKNKSPHMENHMAHHMENEIVNENVFKEEEKGVGKGEGFFLNETEMEDLTNIEINNVKSFIHEACQKKIIDVDVIRAWNAFRINHEKSPEWYASHEKLMIHFRHSLKLEIKNELNKLKSNGTSVQKAGKATGANELLEDIRADTGLDQG